MSSKANNTDWSILIKQLSMLKNTDELVMFFDVLLTISEKDELTNRLNILKALLKGDRTQRKIAKDLHVSIANVSRGANVLKGCPEVTKHLLGKE